ncbi:MAG TPA: hypothetical protein VFP84_29470, partial [Kofleriaceae bacterium]|nr:hypothetical protein [Kofleriaceae bacterium]
VVAASVGGAGKPAAPAPAARTTEAVMPAVPAPPPQAAPVTAVIDAGAVEAVAPVAPGIDAAVVTPDEPARDQPRPAAPVRGKHPRGGTHGSAGSATPSFDRSD